jgi:prepilin-type processing-associated H-X9-DG protein
LPGRGQDRRLSLGELLAALAIIIALSALLLPAFARARANARTAICLGNIRTIAQAVRMYLTDNDGGFPSKERSPEALAYFNTFPGRGRRLPWAVPQASCHRASQANIYLRWPVILDEYLLTRDVWRCPDARLEAGASFINGAGDGWLSHLQVHEGEWGKDTGFCPILSWPVGWGGEVTDSLTQGRIAVPRTAKGMTASPGMFLESIAVNTCATGELGSASLVPDPACYVIAADGGATIDNFGTGTLAYPDLCTLECAGPGMWEADWDHCPWSRDCGAIGAMKTDPELRRPYARHFGGVNIGFLDGHAQWFDSEQVIAESPSTGNPNRGRLRGYEPWAPTRDAPTYDPSGGVPALY